MQVDQPHTARRLSFGSALDAEAARFPMHKFVSYFNEDLDSNLHFLKYADMTSGAGLGVEQNLIQWTNQTQQLSDDLVKLLVQERFLEALLSQDMNQIAAYAATSAEKKEAFQQSAAEAETASQQTERLIRSIDDSIAVICDNYDNVKQTRVEILSELDALNKKQQAEAAAAATAAQQAQQQQADAQNIDPALAAGYEAATRVTNVFSSLFGVEVAEYKDLSASQCEVWLKMDDYNVVLKLRSDTATLIDARVIPALPSCAAIIQRSVASNDMPFLVREIREKINNLTYRINECNALQAQGGVSIFGAATPTVTIKLANGVVVELLVHDEYPKPDPTIKVIAATGKNGAQLLEQLQSTLTALIESGKISTISQIVQYVSSSH
eukprot:TRINITY_DN7374_c0_g1_i1.p1 TRINITY_DN7374_c0_g1~~TRINITY_DN7374_c0_g1_i1.p1  ORF type:complete len:389 (-),score=95.38 TRINITY_DN7374_c0_g1_i1:36-1181(-)